MDSSKSSSIDEASGTGSLKGPNSANGEASQCAEDPSNHNAWHFLGAKEESKKENAS